MRLQILPSARLDVSVTDFPEYIHVTCSVRIFIIIIIIIIIESYTEYNEEKEKKYSSSIFCALLFLPAR